MKGHGLHHVTCESCFVRRTGKPFVSKGEPVEFVKVHEPHACCDCGTIVELYTWWTSQPGPPPHAFKACGVTP